MSILAFHQHHAMNPQAAIILLVHALLLLPFLGCAEGSVEPNRQFENNTSNKADMSTLPDMSMTSTATTNPDMSGSTSPDMAKEPDMSPPPKKHTITSYGASGGLLKTPKHSIRLIVAPQPQASGSLQTPKHRIDVGSGAAQLRP